MPVGARLWGGAGPAAGRFVKLVAEIALGAVLLGTIAAAVLLWRLAQAPVDITAFARAHLDGLATPGTALSIGRAELAWEGFFAADRPVDIRVTDLSLHEGGAVLVSVPHGRVALGLASLLRLRPVPRAVSADGLRLALRRDASGAFTLDRPAAGGGAAASPPWLGALHHVALRDAVVQVRDAPLGLVWRANLHTASLRRAGEGLAGDAEGSLDGGGARVGLTASAAPAADGGTGLHVRATPINPAILARVLPPLRGLAAIEAPVGLDATFNLNAALAPSAAHLALTIGAGRVLAGTGSVAIADGAAAIDATTTAVQVRSLRIGLAAPPKAVALPPTLTASGEAHRVGDRIAARFTLGVDRAAFADLAAYWPPGTGGGGRVWVIENMTTGVARDARVEGSVSMPLSFDTVTVSALTGGVIGEGLTAYWLRPMPPITNARARLAIDGTDALRIIVESGQQGKLRIESGSVLISGINEKDQPGDIEARITGPLPDALALLGHPRLNLLHKLPIPTAGASGTMRTQLTLHLPLDDRVTMDEIRIAADSTLSDLRLRGVVGSYDLEHGALKLRVDTDTLDMSGTGTLAGIPGTFGVFVDFRAGPSSEVVERLTANGDAPAAALRGMGMPADILQGGSVGYRAVYASRRDRTATADLSADLTAAALGSPAGWSKPAGVLATATAQLALARGAIDSVPVLRADGPGLLLRGRMTTAGRTRTLMLDRAQLGRTDLHGSVTLPHVGAPIRVALSGPALDVSPFLKQNGSEPGTSDQAGPAWDATLNVGTLLLGRSEQLAPLAMTAASDGRRVTRARLDAANGGLRATITPARGGRRLSIMSADAGEVLRAAGVTDSVRGGKLAVDASYADAQPHAPLSGTATLDTFRVLDAPAAGRLLKAMTLYGAVDLLRGPGLGFMRAIVPFRWQQRVMHMESARAYSASLGLTVKGDVDLSTHTADVGGTIVPAYFFNQLLGKLPFVGHLFSPEKGGGVFAARYTVKGPLSDPKVAVNALSALTPGILRNLFGSS